MWESWFRSPHEAFFFCQYMVTHESRLYWLLLLCFLHGRSRLQAFFHFFNSTVASSENIFRIPQGLGICSARPKNRFYAAKKDVIRMSLDGMSEFIVNSCATPTATTLYSSNVFVCHISNRSSNHFFTSANESRVYISNFFSAQMDKKWRRLR